MSIIDLSRGTLLADDFPPRLLPSTPKFGLRLSQDKQGIKSGDVFVLGPRYVERRLTVSESLIRAWCEANQEVLRSARTNRTSRDFPYVMVVLREWATDTWLHISWAERNSIDGGTTIALFQDSDDSAPQWGYLQLPDEPLLISTMNSSLSVKRPLKNLLIKETTAVGSWSGRFCIFDALKPYDTQQRPRSGTKTCAPIFGFAATCQ